MYILLLARISVVDSGFNIFYVQYIHPSDAHKLGQAELVCIDEAAAIPLPLVKNLMGPYLVFMSSTINGYVHVYVIIKGVLDVHVFQTHQTNIEKGNEIDSF